MTTISGSTPLMLVMTYGKDKRNYKERISLLGEAGASEPSSEATSINVC